MIDCITTPTLKLLLCYDSIFYHASCQKACHLWFIQGFPLYPGQNFVNIRFIIFLTICFCFAVKFLNIHTPKNCCNYPKIWTKWLFHQVMRPKDAEGTANGVDHDQTLPLWSVWSGSTLFVQACLSENLGISWYWRWFGLSPYCFWIFLQLGVRFWQHTIMQNLIYITLAPLQNQFGPDQILIRPWSR